VRPLYAGGGRRSIAPVVFFKLQLIPFFEDLRSERRLMETVADRLSLRWHVGYDLHEPLPDHSSLTRIREHHGLGVFRENLWLRRRGSPCSRYLVRVAGGPHKDSAGRRRTSQSPRETRHTSTSAVSWPTPETSSRAQGANHPCTATFSDTHWYTMDKATPPNHRKPPKYADSPDAVGWARTCASKLVTGAGVSGS
jgi:hypothetical protein